MKKGRISRKRPINNRKGKNQPPAKKHIDKQKKQSYDQKKIGKSSNVVKRSWQKQEKQPALKKQQDKDLKKQRKNNDNLMKIMITQQTKKSSPDVVRIKQSLGKIKSRGLKQRLKKKIISGGIPLE